MMAVDVVDQTLLIPDLVATLIALVGFLSGVYYRNMSIQTVASRTREDTNFTLVRLFFFMSEFMCFRVLSCGRCEVTLLAYE